MAATPSQSLSILFGAVEKMHNTDAQAPDLFPDLALPRVLQDESLYSWCSRFHRLSGNTRARETSYELFGHPTAGLRPDFPTHLHQFQHKTQHQLATAEELIFQHTQLGLYRPFLSDRDRQSITQQMSSGGSRSIYQHLGLSRSGLGNMVSLRICPECSLGNQSIVPTSYWRMEHQWISVWLCLKHQIMLREFSPPIQRGILDEWYLPDNIGQEQWKEAPTPNQGMFERLACLARWTTKLIKTADLQFEEKLLRHTYLLRAKTNNWIAMDGSLRFHALRDAFSESHRGLESWNGLGFLKDTDGTNGGFLGVLLRDYPGTRHPLKHILLMSFLFSDIDELACYYTEVKSISETDGLTGIRKRLTDTRALLREMVSNQGRSVNASSLALGISPGQAIKHLQKENIPYRLRPRVLTTEIEIKLTQRLKSGTDRVEIAAELGLRKAYIKDYLTQRPTLRREWEDKNLEQRKTRYRQHFLDVLREHPSMPMKTIRRIPGNGFNWLLRNDLAWLQSNLPGIWHRNE